MTLYGSIYGQIWLVRVVSTVVYPDDGKTSRKRPTSHNRTYLRANIYGIFPPMGVPKVWQNSPDAPLVVFSFPLGGMAAVVLQPDP